MKHTETKQEVQRPWHIFLLAGLVHLITSCVLINPPPGIGKALEWSKLPGWQQDRQTEAWPALMRGCQRLAKGDATWTEICSRAQSMGTPSDASARAFFEAMFVPHRVNAQKRNRRGLITGYYEPLLYGSLTRTERFRYPIYRRPDDLLTIELGDLFPDLKRERVRGRLVGSKVVPYYDRSKIDGDANPLRGNELVWVDNGEDLFFLHIQGSGLVELPDGRTVGVGYADQNGHPYLSIGRLLVDRGEIQLEDVSLFSIRDWLHAHPDQSTALFDSNPSYVFFNLRETTQNGAVGSLQVPLTAERSLAVDPETIPLGLPVWLDTSLPGDKQAPYRRLVFAQDTGGAIKGHVRADLFWGHGERAEQMAGTMKQQGRLFVFLPKNIRAQD